MPGNIFVGQPPPRNQNFMQFLTQLALLKVQRDWNNEDYQLNIEDRKARAQEVKAEGISREKSQAMAEGTRFSDPSGPVAGAEAYQQPEGSYYDPRYGQNLTPGKPTVYTLGGQKFIQQGGKFTQIKDPAADKLPSSTIQEWNTAKAGGDQRSLPEFMQWKAGLDQKQGVTVKVENIAGQGETAATKKLGEAVGDQASKRLKMAEEAQTQNFQLGQVKEAINKGASTGWGAETKLDFRRALEGFGIQTGDLSDQELIRKTSNEMALRLRNPESGMGLTGSTSNQDLQFLKDSVIGLNRTERGNLKIIDSMQRLNGLKVNLAKEQQKIIKANGGVVPNDLDERLMNYVDGYKFFNESERKENRRLSQKVINTGVHKDGRRTVQLEDGTWEYAN
jgi:hypothetical protein